MKRRRISRQLVFSMALIVLITLGCSLVAYRMLLKQNFDRMISDEISEGREAVTLKIDERKRRAQLIARFIATDPAISSGLDSGADYLSTQLDRYRATDLEADLLTIANADGVIIAQLETKNPPLGEIRSHEGESLFFNPLFAHVAEGKPVAGLELCLPDIICIDAFEPISIKGTKGRTSGFVRVGFIINDVFAKEVHRATGTDFFLLRNSVALASSLPADKFTADEAAKLADALEPERGEDEKTGKKSSRLTLGGAPYVIESLPVQDAAGRVIGRQAIGRDTSEVARAESKAMALLAAIAGVGLTLALALSIFSARRISRPLSALLDRVVEITKGKLDTHLPINRNDEIGELADAFNEMSRSLSERDRKLRENATELQNRQEQIVQSGKMAAIGELAAGVAHEIGNPLSAISGYAQMIQENQHPAEDISGFATEIEREAEFIERIIQDLLEFSRPSEDICETVDPRALAESAVKTASAHKAVGRVKIERRFAPDIPEIPCRAKEIQQVFLNLIMNAAQAMPNGGTIHIEGELRQNFVLFRVRDEGTGVPPDVKHKIFDPFFTTKKIGLGTGLGLSIVYGIIDKHGGEIKLENTLRGASFAFTLPLDSAN